MPLPGPKTTLELYEVSTTKDATGGRVPVYAKVMDVKGSLQPINASEDSKYNKQTVTAQYKFFVAQDAFTSTQEAKLIESNQLRLGTRKFNITFVEPWTEGKASHYKVMLQEIK